MTAIGCNSGVSPAAPKKPLPVLSGSYAFDGRWGSLQCLDSQCTQKQAIYVDHVHGTLTFGDTVPGTLSGTAVAGGIKVALSGTLSGDDHYRTCTTCALDSASMVIVPEASALVMMRDGAMQSVGFNVRVLNPWNNRPRPPTIGFILFATKSGDFAISDFGLGPSYLRKSAENH